VKTSTLNKQINGPLSSSKKRKVENESDDDDDDDDDNEDNEEKSEDSEMDETQRKLYLKYDDDYYY